MIIFFSQSLWRIWAHPYGKNCYFLNITHTGYLIQPITVYRSSFYILLTFNMNTQIDRKHGTKIMALSVGSFQFFFLSNIMWCFFDKFTFWKITHQRWFTLIFYIFSYKLYHWSLALKDVLRIWSIELIFFFVEFLK